MKYMLPPQRRIYNPRICTDLLYLHIARIDMEYMLELRHGLGDIQHALEDLHMNPNKTTIG